MQHAAALAQALSCSTLLIIRMACLQASMESPVLLRPPVLHSCYRVLNMRARGVPTHNENRLQSTPSLCQLVLPSAFSQLSGSTTACEHRSTCCQMAAFASSAAIVRTSWDASPMQRSRF
jgi:hypothetical protein